MIQVTTAPSRTQAGKLFQKLAGQNTFNIGSLILATLVFSLGKLTVYAADQSQYLVYSLGALMISQILVVIALSVVGKILFRSSVEKLRPVLVIMAILLVSILGTMLFETILRNWNIEPISQSLFQRAISLSFTTFIYLGFGWVSAALDSNFKQVNLGNELLRSLSKQQLELSLSIRDARTFAIREVSLEIQSTRGSIESFQATSSSTKDVDLQISELVLILNEVENRISRISNRLPGSIRTAKIQSRPNYSFSELIHASTKQNNALPGLIAAFAFFGFSSWLGYFLEDGYAFFLGTILSISSFGIFWAYENFLVTKVMSQPVWVRILIYEALVVVYLFFWLVILGYFGGDNSGAYGAAFAYAAIPLIFFNGGAVLGGVVTLSQEYRDNLTSKAFALRREMADLERVRSDEDAVWKSLFVGDIALSPTTASVILRDATITKDVERVLAAIPRVTTLWKSVLVKLPATA